MTKLRSKAAFAMLDPSHLFDGMYIPTKGKKRTSQKLGPYDCSNKIITIRSHEQLGVDDQSMNLAIAAQIGINGNTFEEPKGEISSLLKKEMQIIGVENSTLAAMKTSLRSLMIDAGYNSPDSGKSLREARECLDRLRLTNIREYDPETGWDRSANLISVYFNHKTGEVFVAVNPRLTEAIFFGQDTRISLFERNLLSSEPAKLIHCWLSSYVRQGKSLAQGNGAYLDTLAPHVWGPNNENESRQVRSKRRNLLAKALCEIADATKPLHKGAGWKIEINTQGLVHVTRPNIPKHEAKERLPSLLQQPPSF